MVFVSTLLSVLPCLHFVSHATQDLEEGDMAGDLEEGGMAGDMVGDLVGDLVDLVDGAAGTMGEGRDVSILASVRAGKIV